MSFDIAEIERRLSNLARIGTVAEADYTKALVRVRSDGFTTEWLPWITRRAGGDIDWWAPEVGEQVLVIAPSGLMEDAFVIPALYSNSRPEPEQSPDKHTVRYANGDVVTHDRSNGSWLIQCAGEITVQAGGPVTIIAAGPVLVQAPSVTLDSQSFLRWLLLLSISGAGSMLSSGRSSRHRSPDFHIQHGRSQECRADRRL